MMRMRLVAETAWPNADEKNYWGQVTRTKVAKYECGNCQRRHIGFYAFYYPPMESGYEVDFIWTDWHANERACPTGKHRRDPCDRRCWRCDSTALA